MAYSMDLRRRVVAAVKSGESVASVARRFCVSFPTVCEWRDRDEAGELEPRKPGPTRPRKLTEADDRLMRDQVARRPGITARELKPMLSVSVTISTICRRLINLGLWLKKRA